MMGMDGLPGVAGMIITSDLVGSFPKIPCVKLTSKFQTDLADLDDTLVTPIQTSRSEVVIMSAWVDLISWK